MECWLCDGNMKTALYEAIKGLHIETLVEEDKDELLKLFMITNNSLIRNQLAITFSDAHFNQAIPYLIKKINDKSLYNNNGTLVWALGNLDTEKYYIYFIKIICEQDYEARLMAYGAVEKFLKLITPVIKNRALKVLNKYQLEHIKVKDHDYKGSTLNFIEATQDLLT